MTEAVLFYTYAAVIRLITVVGAILCIYWGYRLFEKRRSESASEGNFSGFNVTAAFRMMNAGTVFALFGMVVLSVQMLQPMTIEFTKKSVPVDNTAVPQPALAAADVPANRSRVAASAQVPGILRAAAPQLADPTVAPEKAEIDRVQTVMPVRTLGNQEDAVSLTGRSCATSLLRNSRIPDEYRDLMAAQGVELPASLRSRIVDIREGIQRGELISGWILWNIGLISTVFGK